MKEKCMALALRQPPLPAEPTANLSTPPKGFGKAWGSLYMVSAPCCAARCGLWAVLSPRSLTLWQESPEEIAKGGK